MRVWRTCDKEVNVGIAGLWDTVSTDIVLDILFFVYGDGMRVEADYMEWSKCAT